MKIEWDEEKRLSNLARHGVDFADAKELFAGPMLRGRDDREDYGEERFIGYGLLRDRLMAVAFTIRGKTIRIISLRKANSRERKRHEEEIRNRLGSNRRDDG